MSIFHEGNDFKNRVGEKYFEDRKLEMLSLRHDDNWTYDKIAIKYGISRERVRQIIGNTGRVGARGPAPRKARSVVTNALVADAYSDLTNDQVLEMGYTANDMQFRAKTRHASRNKSSTMGARIEEWVSAELTKRGVNNSLTNSRPFDIILENGKTVEVKSRHKTNPECSDGRFDDFYFFVLDRYKYSTQSPRADYYIAVVVREGKKYPFVFPKEIVPPSGVIGFRWDSRKSKWFDFENRFDLVR